MFSHVFYMAFDRTGDLIIVARLRVLDWLAGSPPLTTTDRAIQEEGERLRQAFPKVNFDDPTPRRHDNGF